MRVFITGSAGFIGSNLVRALTEDGHRVIGFDKLTYAARRDNLKDLEEDGCYELIVGDVCDKKALTNAIINNNPRLVIHLAAESHVDRSIKDASNFISTNINGTVNLCQILAEQYRCPLFYFSTDEVMGELTGTAETDGKFTPLSGIHPNSPYSASKAAGEMFVRAYKKTFNLITTIIRPTNNYGPYQHPEKFLPLMITRILDNQYVPVYGEGAQMRHWLYVKDTCDAIKRLIYMQINDHRMPDLLLLGSECPAISNLQLLAKVCEQMNVSRYDAAYFVFDRLAHDFRYEVDTSTTKAMIQWQAKVDLTEGIKRTIEFYRDSDFMKFYRNNKEYNKWLRKQYAGLPKKGKPSDELIAYPVNQETTDYIRFEDLDEQLAPLQIVEYNDIE